PDGALERRSVQRGRRAHPPVGPRSGDGRRSACDAVAERRGKFQLMKMRERLEDLERRRAQARAMGGPEKITAQHARGKLTARERLDLLFDSGDMVEIGLHGTEMGPGASHVPGD